MLDAALPCGKRHSFLNFSYACPEPVLVKSSFLNMNGAKSGVFAPPHATSPPVVAWILMQNSVLVRVHSLCLFRAWLGKTVISSQKMEK
jgi:hypothetical protein